MTLKIGAVAILEEDKLPVLFENVASFGMKTCQLINWNPDLYEKDFDGLVAKVKERMAATGVTPSALWAGYSGRLFWNFTEGPVTLGIVPPAHRWHRVQELKRGADFAAACGLKAIITHCGFLPENITDPEFKPVAMAILEVAEYCKKLGIEFWFETGQETPIALLRYIETVGTDNLGINLDPANLLLYGKGNPIDALDVFGKYVRNIHVKDGILPVDGYKLGEETQVGKGKVDFPRFVKKLLSIGFDGEFIIEREIPEGEEQRRDIMETVDNLNKWANA